MTWSETNTLRRAEPPSSNTAPERHQKVVPRSVHRHPSGPTRHQQREYIFPRLTSPSHQRGNFTCERAGLQRCSKTRIKDSQTPAKKMRFWDDHFFRQQNVILTGLPMIQRCCNAAANKFGQEPQNAGVSKDAHHGQSDTGRQNGMV